MELLKHRAGRLGLYLFFALLAYAPLHIFLSTWLGTTFGALEFAKIFKDIVLPIGFVLTLFAAWDRTWARRFIRQPLVSLIAAYALLTVVFALVFDTDQRAELLGVVYNLRFLLIFIYAGLLLRLYKPEYLRRRAIQIVLGIGIVVAAFGVLQYTVLPDNALTHVGYSRENGVLPAFHIDDKPDLERVMSTIRDPNTLGSYLIVIIPLLIAGLLTTKRPETRQILIGGLILAGLAMLFSFSRSGWLGIIVSMLTFGMVYVAGRYNIGQFVRKHRSWVMVGVLVVALFAAGLFAARDSYFVQNVILHSDQSTTLEDPNELRLRFWQESLTAAIQNPFGHGPGTAGLASIQGDHVILNENYYFQILHEVGLIGLVLFLSILVLVGVKLYRAYIHTHNMYVLGLFAAFVGLLATNFLVHIWSNEAVALTFWALVGLYLLHADDGNRQNKRSK
jgi:putative inorganic carbon (HCO3(-)) transporter